MRVVSLTHYGRSRYAHGTGTGTEGRAVASRTGAVAGDGGLRHAARHDAHRRPQFLGSTRPLLWADLGEPSKLPRLGPGRAPVQRRADQGGDRAGRRRRGLDGHLDAAREAGCRLGPHRRFLSGGITTRGKK